ncbi:MAG: DUF2218 domain-containing protein [Pseudomonadota bacterium]
MDHVATMKVPTEKASSYLQQLCKHFAHKVETRFTPEEGSIAFDFGRAELIARDGVLIISANASDQASLERLQRVLSSHLERFAFRETLTMNWGD